MTELGDLNEDQLSNHPIFNKKKITSGSVTTSPRRSTISANSEEPPLAVRILTRPSLPSNINLPSDLDAVCHENYIEHDTFDVSDVIFDDVNSFAVPSESPVTSPSLPQMLSDVVRPSESTVTSLATVAPQVGVHSPSRRCVSAITPSTSSNEKHEEMPKRARNKIVAGLRGMGTIDDVIFNHDTLFTPLTNIASFMECHF